MKVATMLRALSPLGWGVAAAVALGVALLTGHGLGFRWDPFDRTATRLKMAQRQATAATTDAAARQLEVEAAADMARVITHHHQRTVAIERATALAAAEARNAYDASTPLDPDRVARLAVHDSELCRLAPAVCASAPSDAAD